MKAKLFTDGGARGNPGPAAYGYVLEAEDGTVLAAEGEAIGEATKGKPGDPLDNAVRENARLVAAGLRRNPIIAHAKVVAARYDLDTGLVTLL